MKKETKTIRQNQLQSLCNEWQERLKLADWNISVEWIDEGDPEYQKNVHGYNAHDWVNRNSLIRIARPKDYKQSLLWENYNAEATLIHELLHCTFAVLWYELDNKPLLQALLHKEIDSLAWSLYWTKYGQEKTK